MNTQLRMQHFDDIRLLTFKTLNFFLRCFINIFKHYNTSYAVVVYYLKNCPILYIFTTTVLNTLKESTPSRMSCGTVEFDFHNIYHCQKWLSCTKKSCFRYRAYFKDITILIPKSWPDRDYSEAVNESIDVSDVEIGRLDPPNDEPFTINPNQCGDLGLYIHLTPDYLLNSSVAQRWGPREKVSRLLHG